MVITIDLTEEQFRQVTERAGALAVEPAKLVHVAVTDLLRETDDDFKKIVNRVVTKNNHPYKRLR